MKPRALPAAPRKVNIAVTGQCNLRCRYCFYAGEMAAKGDLSAERWLTFLGELGRLRVMEVCLTGGEVFAREDLFEIIDGIVANHMRYSILTNGTLIDETILARWKSGKRRLRLNSIQVSVDGSQAETHNSTRPASFERSVAGLRLLKEEGFPVTVRLTISRSNIGDLEATARLLLEEVGVPSFSTNEAVPMGGGCHDQGEVSLSAQDTREAMTILGRLEERYPGRIHAQAGPQVKRRVFSEMVTARATAEKTQRWTMGFLSSCNCVFSRLDVRHDGVIVPCLFLHKLALGEIGKCSLQELWLNHPILLELRARRRIPMETVPGCGNCEWAPYCSGGCPGIAYELFGDFNRANPLDCYRLFLAEIKDPHGT